MITRDALTRIFLTEWGKSADDANVKFYSRVWWQSSRASAQTAFRLTKEGLTFLVNELELKAYEVPFTEPIEHSPQTMIYLSRYINCPYYLTHNSITVFSVIKSFELYLFSDDIRKYGIIKALNARNKTLDENKD